MIAVLYLQCLFILVSTTTIFVLFIHIYFIDLLIYIAFIHDIISMVLTPHVEITLTVYLWTDFSFSSTLKTIEKT